MTSNAKLRKTREDASLAEAVYESILHRIFSGEFPSGTPLSELEVARLLEVSRTPVHDAMRQLAKDGLLTLARNRRAVVAEFTVDDIYEIFELRKLLEGHAAELAATRMDRRHLMPLQDVASQLESDLDTADWASRWADFDENFHRSIAVASGNRRLSQQIAHFRTLHRGFNKISTDARGLRQALAEHVAILAALQERNGTLARERMVAHIAAWQDYFIRAFPRG